MGMSLLGLRYFSIMVFKLQNRYALYLWTFVPISMALSFHIRSTLNFVYILKTAKNIWRRFPIFWLVHSVLRLGMAVSVSLLSALHIYLSIYLYIWLIVKVVYVCSRSPLYNCCCCLSATRYKEKGKWGNKGEGWWKKRNERKADERLANKS